MLKNEDCNTIRYAIHNYSWICDLRLYAIKQLESQPFYTSSIITNDLKQIINRTFKKLGLILKSSRSRRSKGLLPSINDSSDSRRFVCTRCDRSYKRNQHLARHLRLECGKEPSVRCSVPGCDFVTKRKHALKRHCERVHRGKEAMMKCPKCGSSFKNRHSLYQHQHQRDCGREPRFSCPATGCGYKAKRKEQLKQHRKRFHGLEEKWNPISSLLLSDEIILSYWTFEVLILWKIAL